jgi:glycosyltransferase involved in cell wall biosynthesis
LRHADLALFLNVGDRDYAVSRLGVSLDRTVIVDNGLPDAFLGLDGPSPHDIPHIAAIGSFLERKGTRYLVPALIRLLERHPRLRAGFFGVGVPAEDVLHRFPVQLRSRLEVVEHYSNEALPILLRDYSIQLMPSLAEGFGVAGLEGMACGLALVTTVCSGLAERLVDGEDAVLIPPGSVSAIDTAVQRLLEDADLLARMRRAGQAKAQYFSWNRVGRDNLELYQEVLERKLARRA